MNRLTAPLGIRPGAALARMVAQVSVCVARIPPMPGLLVRFQRAPLPKQGSNKPNCITFSHEPLLSNAARVSGDGAVEGRVGSGVCVHSLNPLAPELEARKAQAL